MNEEKDSKTDIEETLDKNDDNKLNQVKEIFSINIFNRFVDEITSYAKKDFQIFSALFIALITMGIWVIRSIGYCYQAGVFSVYNINEKYIDVGNNFFYQAIQSFGYLIIIFFLNFVFVLIALDVDKRKVHIKRMVITIIVEMILIICIQMIFYNIDLVMLFNDFKNSSLFLKIWSILILFVSTCMINIFALEILFLQKDRAEERKTETGIHISQNSLKLMAVTIIIVSASSLPISYIFGRIESLNRTDYKVIIETKNTTETKDEKYNFNAESISFENSEVVANNNYYNLYAIVYENENVYILSMLYKNKNELFLDKRYQKIIDKQNINTYLLEGISAEDYQ